MFLNIIIRISSPVGYNKKNIYIYIYIYSPVDHLGPYMHFTATSVNQGLPRARTSAVKTPTPRQLVAQPARPVPTVDKANTGKPT